MPSERVCRTAGAVTFVSTIAGTASAEATELAGGTGAGGTCCAFSSADLSKRERRRALSDNERTDAVATDTEVEAIPAPPDEVGASLADRPGRGAALVLTDVAVAHHGAVVFTDLSLSLPVGEGVAVVGPSGSGKSTLLHAVAGLVPLSAGSIAHSGVVVSGLNDRDRRAWRLGSCGMVFQFGELVPELTLQENAELPLRLAGADRLEARRSVGELLERVGLSQVSGKLPGQVSGGQAQRAAIVRALAHRPALVLADEPTGALDEENSAIVLQLLLDLTTEQGANLIVVTHDRSVWERFDRVLRLSDGQLVE